jgi:negative regulator of flagellin synthesis FlgM
MAIEINGSSPNPNPVATNEKSDVKVGRGEPSAAQNETGKPSTGDTVSLTDTASQLNQLATQLANLPVVDTQKVESLQQAIANGSYKVDANQIASGLTQLEYGLYGGADNDGDAT